MGNPMGTNEVKDFLFYYVPAFVLLTVSVAVFHWWFPVGCFVGWVASNIVNDVRKGFMVKP